MQGASECTQYEWNIEHLQFQCINKIAVHWIMMLMKCIICQCQSNLPCVHSLRKNNVLGISINDVTSLSGSPGSVA